jgi:hypothetical protein
MMSFSKIRDGKYYLDLATEDYYFQGDEPDGIWCSSGSLLLNLEEPVTSSHVVNKNVAEGVIKKMINKSSTPKKVKNRLNRRVAK